MNMIKAAFTRGSHKVQTEPLWQYDYGQVLKITGLELPASYEVHFSNAPDGVATTSIGNDDGVSIPDIYLTRGDVYAWLYLHTGENDGETVYQIEIPVRKRASVSDQQPTPVQQDAITQAIAALNAGVSEVEGIAEGIPQTIDTAMAEAKASGEFDGKDGADGQPGADGKDGKDGADGQPGAPGQDGVSPTVAVTDITGGHRVTITDASGDHTFDVMDGSVPVSPKWEVIRSAKITNSTEGNIEVTVDDNGNAFELTDVAVAFVLSAASGESASYGEYGRVRYHYGTNSYDDTLSNAISISVGGSKRGFYTLVEQKDNMLMKKQTSQITTGDSGTMKLYVTDNRASALYPIVILTEQRVYTKIEFRAVKGIADFVIYGKRKPS